MFACAGWVSCGRRRAELSTAMNPGCKDKAQAKVRALSFVGFFGMLSNYPDERLLAFFFFSKMLFFFTRPISPPGDPTPRRWWIRCFSSASKTFARSTTFRDEN